MVMKLEVENVFFKEIDVLEKFKVEFEVKVIDEVVDKVIDEVCCYYFV